MRKILRILLHFEIFIAKFSFMSEWWMKEVCSGFQFNNNQNLFALLLHTNFAFVFVCLCICVFVYLCICVCMIEVWRGVNLPVCESCCLFVYLCMCVFVYLCICVCIGQSWNSLNSLRKCQSVFLNFLIWASLTEICVKIDFA